VGILLFKSGINKSGSQRIKRKTEYMFQSDRHALISITQK